jgi:hypothetical protein
VSEDVGASVRDWLSVVRRARLGRTVKAVAFALALRANPDGTSIFPGLARLSVECELSTKALKEALKALRDGGLIEVVRHGKVSGGADEYRLVLDDVLRKIDVPDPDVHDAAIRTIADRIRGKYTPKVRGAAVTADGEPDGAEENGLRVTGATAEDGPEEAAAGNGTAPEEPSAVTGGSDLRSPPLPATYHVPLQDRSPSNTGEDLRTAVTVPCGTCVGGFVLTDELDIERCVCQPTNVIQFPKRGAA